MARREGGRERFERGRDPMEGLAPYDPTTPAAEIARRSAVVVGMQVDARTILMALLLILLREGPITSAAANAQADEVRQEMEVAPHPPSLRPE